MTFDTAGRKLPLIDCPVAGDAPHDLFVVFMSGDGGWARFDRGVADALVVAGVPVVGWSAFRYFWRTRTPDSVAADLAAVIDEYSARWAARRVALIGFSRGADILPFAANRLDQAHRDRLAGVVLLGVTDEAGFGYRVIDWLELEKLAARVIGPPPGTRQILPEIARLPKGLVTCINGENDRMAAEPAAIKATGAELLVRPGGHHIDQDHAGIARLILDRMLPIGG